MFWIGPIFWTLLLAVIYLWGRREQSRLTSPTRPTRERDARNARIPN